MRELTAHKVNGCNENIAIQVLDEPGHGGACHEYAMTIPNTSSLWRLAFQNGPVAEVGTNGVTHEALLAVLIDRLQGFQKGLYACRENAIALTKLEEAMHWLHHRTRGRVARGVEGTHEK